MPPSVVIAGLDPAIHHFGIDIVFTMDARVKPGHDGSGCVKLGITISSSFADFPIRSRRAPATVTLRPCNRSGREDVNATATSPRGHCACRQFARHRERGSAELA